MNEFECVVYSETGVWWDNFVEVDGEKGVKTIWKKMWKKKNLNCIALHKYPINEKFKKYWLVSLYSHLASRIFKKTGKISENLSKHKKK